jgi:hypothetical protein
MKLLQNVFLAIFLCISVCAKAQIPGYIGKRLYFDAEFQFMPALYTPTATGSIFGLHTRYGLGAGYAISRTRTLTAQVQYLQTGMFADFEKAGTWGTTFDNVLCKLSTVALDVSYSRCRASRGDIAPIGRQSAYHFYFMQASAKDNLSVSDAPVAASVYKIDPTGAIFGLGYSVTYHKMMNDQLMVKYGWQLNLPLSWGISGAEGNQATFKNALNLKFAYYNLVQFKIGIALLN